MKFNALKITLASVLFATGCSNSGMTFYLPQQNATFAGQTYYNNKVDILFVADNSSSMLQYQQRVSDKIQPMIDELDSLGMDYRVGVTTTTMAKTGNYTNTRNLVGTPSYLTSANMNQLANRLIVGQDGSDLARGLDAMYLVTQPTFPGMFLRDDALFVVIFISDEADQSSEFGNPDSNDFLNYLNSRKPAFANGTRAWIANFIGTLVLDHACDILGGQPSVGSQFIKLVQASNGIQSSICEADLTAAVSGIKARIVSQLTSYVFRDVPNKSTIQVTVGDRTVVEDATNGWTLETELNASGQTIYILNFHGTAIPAASESVIVNYKAQSAS